MNRRTAIPIVLSVVAITATVVFSVSLVGISEFSNWELQRVGGDLRMKPFVPPGTLTLSLLGYISRASCNFGWLLPVAAFVCGAHLLRAPERDPSVIAWYCCFVLVILAFWTALTILGFHATFIASQHLA